MTIFAAAFGALIVWFLATLLRRLGRTLEAPAKPKPSEELPKVSKLPAPYTEAFETPEAAFQSLLDENAISGARAETLRRAFELAKKSHSHQKRDGTDDPYIYHPLDVLGTLLEELEVEDVDTLVAGLLHDVAEDGGISLERIEADFGTGVAAIVGGLTRRQGEEKEAYLERVRTGPRNVRLIKIAHRLNNIEDLFYIRDNREKVQKYLAQTRKHILPMVEQDAPVLMERYQRAFQTLEEGYEQERELEKMQRAAEMVQAFDALLDLSPDERRKRELERKIGRAKLVGDLLTEAGRITGIGSMVAVIVPHAPIAIGLGAGTLAFWLAAIVVYLSPPKS